LPGKVTKPRRRHPGGSAFVPAEIDVSADTPLNTTCYDCSKAVCGRALAAKLLGNIRLGNCVLVDAANPPNPSTAGGVENERNNQIQVKKLAPFLESIIVISLVAVLGVLIYTSQAATPDEPLLDEAFVQLNPSTGVRGTIFTVDGHGWQPGETVLVYLVEAENGSTDGAVYGGAVVKEASAYCSGDSPDSGRDRYSCS
jgi:hypothetical protein